PWLPCRLVPMDGGSPGRSVGPPSAPCTFAAWSPDAQMDVFQLKCQRSISHLAAAFSQWEAGTDNFEDICYRILRGSQPSSDPSGWGFAALDPGWNEPLPPGFSLVGGKPMKYPPMADKWSSPRVIAKARAICGCRHSTGFRRRTEFRILRAYASV